METHDEMIDQAGRDRAGEPPDEPRLFVGGQPADLNGVEAEGVFALTEAMLSLQQRAIEADAIVELRIDLPEPAGGAPLRNVLRNVLRIVAGPNGTIVAWAQGTGR